MSKVTADFSPLSDYSLTPMPEKDGESMDGESMDRTNKDGGLIDYVNEDAVVDAIESAGYHVGEAIRDSFNSNTAPGGGGTSVNLVNTVAELALAGYAIADAIQQLAKTLSADYDKMQDI